MNNFKFLLPILLLCSLQACGQIGNHQHNMIDKMEYGKINNTNVKAAVAKQANTANSNHLKSDPVPDND